jgi:uncharacterized membrane protein
LWPPIALAIGALILIIFVASNCFSNWSINMDILTPEFKTFLLAMTPLGELRLSLPIALTVYRLDWQTAYFFSVIGNLVPIILLFTFLPIFFRIFSKLKFFEKFFSWFFHKTRKRYNSKIENYGYLALFFFVVLPFPMTGAWTGSLVAFLFGIPFKIAFSLISLGIIAAGIIVLILVNAGIAIEKYFGWQILLGIIILLAFFWLMYKLRTRVFNVKN